MKSLLPLIFGMAAVTYLPRLLPLIIMTERPINPLIKRFLLYIPYTALSALIVRGIMETSPEIRLATLIGVIAAGMCSIYLSKGGLVLSVMASVITALLVLQL